MRFYQRVCLIIALQGIRGLISRFIHKIFPKRQEPGAIEESYYIKRYSQMKENFIARAKAMGFGDLSNYYWYHTVDLGNGLITPGAYDFRPILPFFRFPEHMTGLNVLDIGSATGFFSFEFEKRGANVLSVDLPSISDWDMPLGEDKKQTLDELMAYHNAKTIEEVTYFHLDGPFEFCRKVLNSKVERRHSTIYDLTAEKLGRSVFDLVYIGDVILHLFSPLKALAAVAPLCTDTLIISGVLTELETNKPLMLYAGGNSRSGDKRTWWYPNMLCLKQMLNRLGFKEIQVIGNHECMHQPSGYKPKRTIIHAKK